jgi:hypothetical protein
MSSTQERQPEHVATFYRADDLIVERVASFVIEGLAARERVIVIATAPHWNAIAARVDDKGVPNGRGAADSRLVFIEADELLDAVTTDDGVDVAAFKAMLVPLLEPGLKTRIYGELVSLLAQRGDVDGAVTIERLGHELAHSRHANVLCGYCLTGPRPLGSDDIARIQHVHDRSMFEADEGPPAGIDTQVGEERQRLHAVRFYEDRESLARIVGDFLGKGLIAGLPAIVIATPEHRDAITRVLRARSLDVVTLEGAGDLIIVDAEETLARFMVRGMPDEQRFKAAVIPLIERACRGRKDCVVRAYGEMVDVLWTSGQTAAAIRLETLWNQLAHTHSFGLLCGYSMGHFYKDAAQLDIRNLHAHVVPEQGDWTTVH